MYDVIISGGGPSGTLLGYYLSQNGIKTLIIEKNTFPRQKVCAGGIQHRILDLIPFDITPVVEKTITGIYFSYKNRDIFLKRYSNPILYTVDRRKFDDFFAGKAAKSGCEIRFGEETRDYRSSVTSIQLVTDKKKYNAKILVGADGIKGLVHRKLLDGRSENKILGYMVELPYILNKNEKSSAGIRPEDRPFIRDRNDNIFKLYDSVRLDFNDIRKCYSWVFPKKDFFSTGIGAPVQYAGKIKKYFRSFLDSFYTSSGTGDYPPNILAHGIPLKNKNFPLRDYRVIAIGDAACLADSFTGEGLYNSFRSSAIAFDAIKTALKRSSFDFDNYARRIRDDIYVDIRYADYFSKIFYSHSRFFYKLIKKNDNYFYACCRLLRGERTYPDVFKRIKSMNIVK